MSEGTFSQFLEVNLEFSGLFIIMFCLFLVMGLIPAVYLSVMMKRMSRNQSGNSDISINANQGNKIALAFQRFRLNSEAADNAKHPLGAIVSPGVSSQFGANLGRFGADFVKRREANSRQNNAPRP